MSTTRQIRSEISRDPLLRLVELLARVEVERYLNEIENKVEVGNDAECGSGDLRQI